MCDTFEHILSSYPNSPIWLVGDLNLPNIDWEHYCIRNSTYPSSLCDTLIDFVHEYGFSQLVDFATRDNNILDVFFTNRPCLIRHCYPIAGISGHEAVFVESLITLNLQHSKPRKIYIWHKANMSSIKNLLIQSSQLFSVNSLYLHQSTSYGKNSRQYALTACHLCLQNSAIPQLNNLGSLLTLNAYLVKSSVFITQLEHPTAPLNGKLIVTLKKKFNINVEKHIIDI